jgi:bromodomain-containing protein 8
MTPDEEDFTGSETATPTSTSAAESRRKLNSGDQRQKAWQKNINLLWQEIANHKNGTIFMNPIKKSYAPLYDKVVKQPLYLKTIKNRVRDGVSAPMLLL